jgi:hypothetical protein
MNWRTDGLPCRPPVRLRLLRRRIPEHLLLPCSERLVSHGDTVLSLYRNPATSKKTGSMVKNMTISP